MELIKLKIFNNNFGGENKKYNFEYIFDINNKKFN